MTRALPFLLCLACGSSGAVDEPVGGGSGGTAVQGPAEDEPAPTTSAEPALEPAMAALLAAHDRARADHCAPPLEWSAELASAAAGWARDLAGRGCPLEHSQSGLGENLFAATAGSRGPDHVVQVWVDEREAFDFERGGFGMATGHFTQVVWKGTERIGCATIECHGLDLWVCNYDPPGNVRGGYRANVSPLDCAD